MMAQRQFSEVLGAIEQAFVQNQPFGNSTYIHRQLEVCLKRRLDKVSGHLPTAGKLLDAFEHANEDLPRVIGDTVVRCAILHAHIQFETNAPYGLALEDCEKVFAATVRHLQSGNYDTPLDQRSLRRLGSEPYLGWIWTEEHPDDIFGRSFRYLLKERYFALPCTPSSDEIALLEQGARLLRELLPTLTPSVLSHAHVIACVPSAGGWKGTASSSQFHLGGTIFLGRPLQNPWWVAEHLLHESLHQKLYDFRQAHSLLELDYSREDAPRVYSPWNSQQLNNANQWDVHRVFAAFHVYVHLALLAIAAEQRAPELEDTYGPLHAMLASRKALERAHYLGEQLKEHCWNELGLAGKGLADWLSSALGFLDPSPPPKGAYVHLCLDLYETEANRVAAALKESESLPSNLPQRLIPLAKEEVESARRVLSAIDARPELDRFNSAVAQYAENELGTKFPELRRVIGMALIEASLDRYRLTESGAHEELLKQMIESASRRVYSVLAGYPLAVADAKRRASELRFGMSCEDDVGRLLTVLAAAVPSGGRLLEIGTGVGVGTAWIVAGLDERTDVEVLSVEIDPRLSNATRDWPWPDYVQIVTADVMAELETIGTFDLVFADASPVKYSNIDSLLKTLRPGGILVMDDLGPPNFSERQRADKDALCRSLMNHHELHVVDIEWSTGLIVATKSRCHSRPAIGKLPSGEGLTSRA
jgi:predicted O-methyltransferase YrrM